MEYRCCENCASISKLNSINSVTQLWGSARMAHQMEQPLQLWHKLWGRSGAFNPTAYRYNESLDTQLGKQQKHNQKA